MGRYLKAQNPAIQIIGADPEGSVYSGGQGRPYLVEGIGEDFWPATYDRQIADRVNLADEPTGNLNSRQGEEIMELFKQLNNEGVTIIQVTHSEKNAAYGTHIINLLDGRVEL